MSATRIADGEAVRLIRHGRETGEVVGYRSGARPTYRVEDCFGRAVPVYASTLESLNPNARRVPVGEQTDG